jgi:hypothetical protein
MRLFFNCEAAAAATLSMSIGSECPPDAEEPEEVNEEEADRLLGVEAAVEAAELLFDEAEHPPADTDDAPFDTEVLEALSGRLALIHEWFNKSLRDGRSLGLTLRHLLMMS